MATKEIQGISEATVKEQPSWNPTEEQKRRIKYVMDDYADMDHKRKQSYTQFNDRTLVEFIDDSQKRLNSYVLSREEQGKEPWQSNFATRIPANKTKALLASTARQIPDMRFKATDEDDSFKYFEADVIKNLTRHSYNQSNPVEDLFFLAWSTVGSGTVLSYEGFEKSFYIKKSISSFDVATGDIEFKEEEKISEGEPVSFEIPLTDLLIKNFYIRDIQDQPCIIWETYYAEREQFETVWGKYNNVQFVPDAADLTDKQSQDTFFHGTWHENCSNGKGFLVMRYMNKFKDIYRVVANGVEIYNGPMLWPDITSKRFGKKMYPIAKTIFEAFAEGNFFYGNSLPNSAMGETDVINALYNGAIDKTYRALVPGWLVGQTNKGQLDLEDDVMTGDTKIYVEDINQIKQLDIKGISSGDVQLLDMISAGVNMTTLDPQQEGSAQKYVTARASVAADERARQLKGVFFMFLESLWLQKVRLRVPNIILSYTRPRIAEIIGEDGSTKLEQRMRTFNVDGVELSDKSKGVLSIGFAPQEDMMDPEKQKMMKQQIDAQETAARDAGQPLEKIIMPYGFFDNLSFDLEIIPETLWQSSQAINMAMIVEKIGTTMKAFPEYFAENKAIFFTDLMKAYGDDVGRYNIQKTMGFEDQKALEMAGMGAGGGAPGNGQAAQMMQPNDAQNITGG